MTVRRFVLAAAVALSVVAAAPAGASKPGVSGSVNCSVGGALLFNHGLPLTAPGPASRAYTEHLRGITGATGCTIATTIAFDTIIVKLQGVSVTQPGSPLPSCTGLAGNPQTTYKATLQFRRNGPHGPTVATSKASLSSSAVSLGTPVSFDVSGKVGAGAFKGEGLALHMAFDQQWPYLVVDCSDANGLNNLDMTGIFASTLTIAP